MLKNFIVQKPFRGHNKKIASISKTHKCMFFSKHWFVRCNSCALKYLKGIYIVCSSIAWSSELHVYYLTFWLGIWNYFFTFVSSFPPIIKVTYIHTGSIFYEENVSWVLELVLQKQMSLLSSLNAQSDSVSLVFQYYYKRANNSTRRIQ